MGKQETKICKYCKSEIPYEAKVCPNCRKKQKGGILKWILVIFVVLVVIVVAAGGTDDDAPSNQSPKKVKTESDEPKSNGKENDVEDPDEENRFSVGDVVETSDLRISFTGAGKYKSDNEFLQPESGNVYFKMDFEFENISDSDETVSSWDFKCYADGYDMEQAYMDGMDLDARLSPGKKTKGSVFFEVPKDSNEITLEYETNAWTEDKIVFIVK